MPPVVVSGGGFGREINTRKDIRERTKGDRPGQVKIVLPDVAHDCLRRKSSHGRSRSNADLRNYASSRYTRIARPRVPVPS